MRLKRAKPESEKLITKPVTMRPNLIEQVNLLAKQEDRTFSQMARLLIEQAVSLRQAQSPQPQTLAQANQISS